MPTARLIVDANEGWGADILPEMLAACARYGVELVEQPLPASDDEALRGMARSTVICADKSAHGIDSLKSLKGKYDAVNIKLDKTGGLSPALAMADAAHNEGFKIMVGCMLATSLAMAPAFIVAQKADYVDLDGPLLLAKDRRKRHHISRQHYAAPTARTLGLNRTRQSAATNAKSETAPMAK